MPQRDDAVRHRGRAGHPGASGGCALVTLVVALLAGCAGSGPAERGAAPTLVVNETLALPPGSARVTIQGGRTVERSLVAKFSTWCQLRVAGSADAPAVERIRPGRFEIVSRRSWIEARAPEPVRLAGPLRSPLAQNVGPVARLTMHTELRLTSAGQPGVERLLCGRDGDWHDHAPTLDDIAATLEPLATLQVGGH